MLLRIEHRDDLTGFSSTGNLSDLELSRRTVQSHVDYKVLRLTLLWGTQ
jgi:hypothetical protein